jgi:ABC-type nitrate/sulfonate/bicarbonate transport system permease component
VMGAVIAEWLGSDKGIGVYMLLSKNSFRTDRVFAAIAIIVGLSLFLFGFIAFLEKIVIRWNVKS